MASLQRLDRSVLHLLARRSIFSCRFTRVVISAPIWGRSPASLQGFEHPVTSPFCSTLTCRAIQIDGALSLSSWETTPHNLFQFRASVFPQQKILRLMPEHGTKAYCALYHPIFHLRESSLEALADHGCADPRSAYGMLFTNDSGGNDPLAEWKTCSVVFLSVTAVLRACLRHRL